MQKILRLLAGGLLALCVAACTEERLPRPVTIVNIGDFQLKTPAESFLERRVSGDTIHLYVADNIDLKRVQMQAVQVNVEHADIKIDVVDKERCADYANFPRKPFSSLAELSTSANTFIDFSDTLHPVRFRVTTYDSYDFSVLVHQHVERKMVIRGLQSAPIIDQASRQAVIYVSSSERLDQIHVEAFQLGGAHGKVTPDPTTAEVFDFQRNNTFMVQHYWESEPQPWKVFVYRRDMETTMEISPMSSRAIVEGTIPADAKLQIQFCPDSTDAWSDIPSEDISIKALNYRAIVKGLSPETKYRIRTVTNGNIGDADTLTTAPAPELPGGLFDDWHKEKAVSGDILWCPWMEGEPMYWDTGNHGATTVGASNSVPTDETCNGRGKAAFLESKYIVIKFAAGNIFTGKYKKTDGTNGILDFGRPFTGYPTKLRVNYKYLTQKINHCDPDERYKHLIGRPDSCQIYVALTDWDQPLEVRTRPSNQQLFDINDPHIIAYAEIIKGENVPEWTQVDMELKYRNYRTPKHLLIVVTSSKYGDFFTGGEGAKLWVDNFELIYD